MSIFLCRAVVVQAHLGQADAQSGERSEQEVFEARSAELAREVRHQRRARMTGAIAAAWTRVLDRLTSASREQKRRTDLMEKLENMPAYMLKDIGVTRDNVGRYCYHNDFGMLVDLAAADPEKKPEGRTEGEGPQVAYAAK